MVKKLSCVSCGSLKRFPHTFTNCALDYCALLVLALKKVIIASEKLFLSWVPKYEYLEKLEGKIRKCLFFYVKIF